VSMVQFGQNWARCVHIVFTLAKGGFTSPGVGHAAEQERRRTPPRSSLDLTMNVCTDPSLFDVADAAVALPRLPLQGTVGARVATPGRTARSLAIRVPKA